MHIIGSAKPDCVMKECKRQAQFVMYIRGPKKADGTHAYVDKKFHCCRSHANEVWNSLIVPLGRQFHSPTTPCTCVVQDLDLLKQAEEAKARGTKPFRNIIIPAYKPKL